VASFHADLITMFVIMVPMYLMYEISIWVALIFGKKKVDVTDKSESITASE
jgi:sec-independent protein translocase protein TatC